MVKVNFKILMVDYLEEISFKILFKEKEYINMQMDQYMRVYIIFYISKDNGFRISITDMAWKLNLKQCIKVWLFCYQRQVCIWKERRTWDFDVFKQ